MTEMLSQGMNLTLFGMGTVLAFLSILILVTQAMSAILLRLDALSPARNAETNLQDAYSRSVAGHSDLPDARTRAIIQAAIDKYRAGH